MDCFVAIAPRNDEFDGKTARRANHFCFSEIESSPEIKNIFVFS